MTFASSQIGVDQEVEGPLLRAMATSVMAVDIGLAVSAEFPPLFPMIFDGTNWKRWAGGSTQLNTLTAAATTATGGTYTITVNFFTTAPIDHDADAATIEAALVATGLGTASEMSITDAGGGLAADNGTVSLFWNGGNLAEQPLSVTADFSGLIGNVHVLTTPIAGTVNKIDAFVWPDSIFPDISEEVIGNLMFAGRINLDDCAVDQGRNLGSIKASMRIFGRRSPYTIEGLRGFG